MLREKIREKILQLEKKDIAYKLFENSLENSIE
jgi:hypothetical protein